MKTRLIAILVIALTALLENFVEAQEEPQNISTNSLPGSLPMVGLDSQAFREWIVTNRECSVGCLIRYTNTSNQRVEINPFAQRKNFTSYAEFDAYVQERGVVIWGYMQSRDDFTPSTQVTFGGQLYYHRGDGLGGGFVFLNGLGPVSGITADSFANVRLKYHRASLAIPNLERLIIKVGVDPMSTSYYHYEWIRGIGGYSTTTIKPQPLSEVTADDDAIVFNEWYSTNVNQRVRFTITAGGQTRTYTQYGDMLGSVVHIEPLSVNVSMARGSDTTLQSSTDMVNWVDVTTFDWSLGRKDNSVAIAPYSPRQLYRAVSN